MDKRNEESIELALFQQAIYCTTSRQRNQEDKIEAN